MDTTFDGTAGAAALRLHEVRKAFGPKQAVDGLSFQVARGELVCLLGPNGAGKTTTIEMCEGFTKPSSGAIEVLGIDPAARPDAVRERVGIMLQGGGSYSGVRVREMLRLSAAYSRHPLDPDWLLEVLGLEGVASTTYRRLSGGQKQRLSLALALIGRPELVFLDEPTAGMDAQSRLAVWDLIGALRRDGVTIVLTTHLMDEAEALADRVIIMDHGRVVATGTPSELMSGAIGALTFDTDREVDLAALRSAGVEAQAIRPLRYAVAGQPTPEAVAQLAAGLAAQKVLARRIETAHSTLEDIFLELTGREVRS